MKISCVTKILGKNCETRTYEKKNQKEIQTEMISRNTAATTIIKSKFLFFVLEGHIIQNGGAHKTSVLIQPIPFLCRQISSSKIVFDNLWTIYSTSGGFL